MVGTSGAITSLAGIHLNLNRYQRNLVDGLWMTRGDCEAAADRLKALGPQGRAAEALHRSRPRRSGAGRRRDHGGRAARLAVERVRVADRGLREGLLLQRMREDRKPVRRKRRRGRGRGGAGGAQPPAT
jgi:exopolyphosphatase/guanosine-5'-triphosphate,3'-diphosphate pyrophosphatase